MLVVGHQARRWLTLQARSGTAPSIVGILPLSRTSVHISDARMDEFITAEITHFATRAERARERSLEPLALREWSERDEPLEVARLVNEELPLRFAARLKYIEGVQGWEQISELVHLRDLHFRSFRDLRLADVNCLEEFQGVIQRIRKRHKCIVPLFAEAVRVIKPETLPVPDWDMDTIAADSLTLPHDSGLVEDTVAVAMRKKMNGSTRGPVDAPSLELEQWADTFLLSRICTEMLMAHFIACIESKSSHKKEKLGILDYRGDPAKICRKAAETVQNDHWPCPINVTDLCGKLSFCHIPRYLFYIMEELLKNSARATFEASEASGDRMKPIQVTVCADSSGLAIRIQDEGGGMPFNSAHKIWSYTFSTQKHSPFPPLSSFCEPNITPDDPIEESPWGVFGESSPIYGRGMGLPLSRLYAMYMGGSLHVMNMPGLGMDTHLSFKRIDPRELGH